MKQRFTSFLLVFSVLALVLGASCTRKYTCQCTMTYTGKPGLPQGETREYSITDTKKNAQNSCRANSRTYDDGGIHTVENCDLF